MLSLYDFWFFINLRAKFKILIIQKKKVGSEYFNQMIYRNIYSKKANIKKIFRN